jgi:hypothetical protein
MLLTFLLVINPSARHQATALPNPFLKAFLEVDIAISRSEMAPDDGKLMYLYQGNQSKLLNYSYDRGSDLLFHPSLPATSHRQQQIRLS